MLRWIKSIIGAIADYRRNPSFNFNPGPGAPEIPIVPERPGQPRTHK